MQNFTRIAFVVAMGIGICLWTTEIHARCGYYAGYGYRCFGDKGGTGGKVFKEMDKNSKACGYWDPGCQHGKHKQNNKHRPSTKSK